MCVEERYKSRIADLQARYQLIPDAGPITYICEGNPYNTVSAMFFKTDPPTLTAEHGDSVSLIFLQKSGSGAKNQGRNEALWGHHVDFLITWGLEAPEIRCKKVP